MVLGFLRGNTVHQVNVTRVWDPSHEELNAVMGGGSNDAMPVRPSKVIEGLYLGDSAVSRNKDALRDENIAAIINVAKECPNHFEGEIHYLHIPLEDKPTQDIRNALDTAADSVARSMMNGDNVLLHCSGGESRGPAICIGALMREKKATLLQVQHVLQSVSFLGIARFVLSDQHFCW